MITNQGNALTHDKIRSKLKNQELVLEKRRRILQGASSVFKEKGFHKATVRDIAKSAGISMGTLYDCITTKADVLYLFYTTFISAYQERVISLTQEIDDPRERLRVAYKTLIEVYFSLEDEILFGWTESKNMRKDYLYEVLRTESDLIDYLREILDEIKARFDSDIGDTTMVANFLVFSATFGVLRRWSLKPQYNKDQILEYLMNTQVMKVLLPPNPDSAKQEKEQETA